MRLEDLIAEIWNRAHRVFPKRVGANILRFLIYSESEGVDELAYSADEAPYPAQWAGDSPDPAQNIRWGEGVWS